MALRRASLTSNAALEQLDCFIISYGFYTSLLEEEHLAQFRVLWIEVLGDLARYKMAVVAHGADGAPRPSTTGIPSAMLMYALAAPYSHQIVRVASPKVSRINGNDMSAPSIGLQAAAEMEMEDERELWRMAREWHAKGTNDTPGQGRLHDHLGLVSADAEGEELRAIYHFAKRCVYLYSFFRGVILISGILQQPRRHARVRGRPQIHSSPLFHRQASRMIRTLGHSTTNLWSTSRYPLHSNSAR